MSRGYGYAGGMGRKGIWLGIRGRGGRLSLQGGTDRLCLLACLSSVLKRSGI